VRIGYRMPRVWAWAALAPLLAHFGMNNDWDTVRLVLRLLVAGALAGSFLAALSPRGRHIVASLLIGYHLLGILVASRLTTSGSDRPWLAEQIWMNLYRSYLGFIGLDTSYDFYAPEPRPETALWFRVEYADGHAQWVKLPNRKQYWTSLEYARFMAVANGTEPGVEADDLDELSDQRLE